MKNPIERERCVNVGKNIRFYLTKGCKKSVSIKKLRCVIFHYGRSPREDNENENVNMNTNWRPGFFKFCVPSACMYHVLWVERYLYCHFGRSSAIPVSFNGRNNRCCAPFMLSLNIVVCTQNKVCWYPHRNAKFIKMCMPRPLFWQQYGIWVKK